MTVTRRAVIIANPGEQGNEGYCKGVEVDVHNYRRLLMAPHGGYWKESEIDIYYRPTKAEVRNAIRMASLSTYAFIVFSGHGWYSAPDECNVLELRKGEQISADELRQHHWGKRTIVLDCCRRIHHETIADSEKRASLVAMSSVPQRRHVDAEACRSRFDELLMKAGDGLIEITSCDLNQTAGDDSRRGGLYSSRLILFADAWKDEEEKKPLWSPDNASSVARAHEVASADTSRYTHGTQQPQIEKPRSGPYFPFAVFATRFETVGFRP